MKKGAAPSRTPILDTYKIRKTSMPMEPDVERYICRSEKTIYINTAAKPGAKIVRLMK